MAAAERRASVDAQLQTVVSDDELSPLTPTQKLHGATKKIMSLGKVAKRLDPYGRIVRPGFVDCDAIIQYFMHGPPRKGDDGGIEFHLGHDHLQESVERVMFAIFDDRLFLYDAFKCLDSEGNGLLTEDQMAHWVSCITTCSPVQQATTSPSPRCKRCSEKGFTPYRCKCVPRALPEAETEPDVGRAEEWNELGPLGTTKKERVGWASEAVASTTLQEQMKNIIEDCLQKRAPVAAELAADAPPVYFDWHDFLVVTMDFYVALGTRSMHAIFSVLLGNDCDELGPALETKAKTEPSGDDEAATDESATRPAAKAAFQGTEAREQAAEQQIGTQSGGGLFGCCRPQKEEAGSGSS